MINFNRKTPKFGSFASVLILLTLALFITSFTINKGKKKKVDDRENDVELRRVADSIKEATFTYGRMTLLEEGWDTVGSNAIVHKDFLCDPCKRYIIYQIYNKRADLKPMGNVNGYTFPLSYVVLIKDGPTFISRFVVDTSSRHVNRASIDMHNIGKNSNKYYYMFFSWDMPKVHKINMTGNKNDSN
ncbi:MAG: hypothetical protein SGJ04_02985 [Bacteroidota bacterium]|nr:hypothetical protein [Bacteroidota bacterium]